MVTDVAFSKADDRGFRSNQRFFYAIILTTAACLAIQGSIILTTAACLAIQGSIILTIAACLAIQGRKGQPDGRLKSCSRRVQGSD